jgi:hypothetical protein
MIAFCRDGSPLKITKITLVRIGTGRILGGPFGSTERKWSREGANDCDG